MKKLVVGLMCLIGVLVLLGACSPAATPAAKAPAGEAKNSKLDELYEAAKKDGELIWQVARPQAQLQPVKTAFEKRFPDIKVTVVDVNATQIASRLVTEAQAQRISIDVGNTTAGQLAPLVDRDLVLAVDYSGADVDPQDVLMEGKLLSGLQQPVVAPYNTNLVKKEDVPTKWEDFLDPKWQGKITAQAPGAGFAAPLIAGEFDEAKMKSFAEGIGKQKPVVGTTGVDSLDRLARGEVALSGAMGADVIVNKMAEGAPVDIAPISPTQLSNFGLFTLKGVAHPNAAKLFMVWAGSPEGRARFKEVGWGRLTPCGPSPIEKAICGKDFKFVHDNSIESAQKNAMAARIMAAELAKGR